MFPAVFFMALLYFAVLCSILLGLTLCFIVPFVVLLAHNAVFPLAFVLGVPYNALFAVAFALVSLGFPSCFFLCLTLGCLLCFSLAVSFCVSSACLWDLLGGFVCVDLDLLPSDLMRSVVINTVTCSVVVHISLNPILKMFAMVNVALKIDALCFL